MQVEEKSLNGQKIAIGKGFIGFFCIIYSPNSRTWTFILSFKSIEMTATSVVALYGRLEGTNMAHGDMKVFEFFCQWFTLNPYQEGPREGGWVA